MTKALPLPSQEYLQECFHYEPTTGKLFWKERPLHHFKDGRAHKTWNTQRAGKEINSKHTKQGYIYFHLDATPRLGHRVIWKLVNGVDPRQIDHIDGDVLNNRVENLRCVGHGDNNRNQKLRRTNKTGVPGVRVCKNLNKWVATIGDGSGNKVYLPNPETGKKHFESKIDAIYARYYAEQDYGFHENHGRI